MAAALPFSRDEKRLLAALVKHKVRFMIVGLSAATLQGAPVVTQDVDLWFEDLGSDEMLTALREVGAAYVPPSAINPPMLAGKGAELFDVVLRMSGLGGFAEELKNCVRIRLGQSYVNVLSLSRILDSKVAANREKDRLTIPVLRDTLTILTVPHRKRSKRRKNR